MLVDYNKAMSMHRNQVITLPSYKSVVIDFMCNKEEAYFLSDMYIASFLIDHKTYEDDYNSSLNKLKTNINKELNKRGLLKCK